MAHMFPDQPSETTESAAERRLFRVIKLQTGDDWLCLHSLGLTTHALKPWAEVDFVLIGPSGVFCLEVKGGRVARSQGEWLFTNRNGRTTRKREGPFEQVAGASSALRNFLYDCRASLRGALIQYGVVLPDVLFDLVGPDIEADIVYDSRDTGDSFGHYLDRLAHHWSERSLERYGREPLELDSGSRRAILELLRPDFDLVPTMRSRIEAARVELVRLTGEQAVVMRGLAGNARAIVRGGAGTGKTLLALEEARRLGAEGRSVLLVCYNRQLADWLQGAVADSPLVTARGLHAFMRELIIEGGDRLLPEPDSPGAFDQIYPQLALAAVLEEGAGQTYDALVIDEGQDILTDNYLDVLDSVIEGGLPRGTWRIFLDPNQNLFGGLDAQSEERLQALGVVSFMLTINCRNTIPIALETSLLSGAPLCELLVADGPEVRHHWSADMEERACQLDSVVKDYLMQGVRHDQIVVLSPRKFELSGVPSTLGSVRCAPAGGIPRHTKEAVIVFSTIQGFKGLEADVILLTGLGNMCGQGMDSAFYVGSSRARACLDLFLDESSRSEYDSRAAQFGIQLAALKAPLLPWIESS